MNLYEDGKTLTGFTLPQAIDKLKEPFPSDVYKTLPHATYLKDIPAWHTIERLTQVFGPYGLGFGVEWEPENLYVSHEKRTNRDGEIRYVWVAGLDHAKFWVSLLTSDGKEHTFRFTISGGAENDNRNYAIKGARTNAIGDGASRLLFQIHIYKGEDRLSPSNDHGQHQPTAELNPGGMRVALPKAKELTGKDNPTVQEIASAGEDGIKYLQWIAGNITDKAFGDAARKFLDARSKAMAPSADGNDGINNPNALLEYAERQGKKYAGVALLFADLGIRQWPEASDAQAWLGLKVLVDKLNPS